MWVIAPGAVVEDGRRVNAAADWYRMKACLHLFELHLRDAQEVSQANRTAIAGWGGKGAAHHT